MIKSYSITIFALGILSINALSQFTNKSEAKIYGCWVYEQVTINGRIFDASSLNECGYKDVLEIRRNSRVAEAEFDGIKIKGRPIGYSNAKICSVNPVDFTYSVVINSCATEWVRLVGHKNRMVCIAEGFVIEYEIEQPDRKTMHLLKIRSLVNYGEPSPEKIVLKRIKK